MSNPTPEEQILQFHATEKYLREALQPYPSLQFPKALIICGSGLGGLSKLIKDDLEHPKLSISYADIPGFKQSHVPGHLGELIFGILGENSTPVMCMVGRFHYYEGHSFCTNTLPIRVAKLLGVQYAVITNAAGGVNESFRPGDLMVIDDHINLPGLAGQHPLRGLNLDTFGPRFLPLSDCYDFDLRLKFFRSAQSLGINRVIHEGTYCYVCGPTFESRAEVRMIRKLGADAVGMSTVPEAVVARHCGIKVFGLSLITNAALADKPPSAKAAYLSGLDPSDVRDQTDGMASHGEVLETANSAAADVERIVEHFISSL